VTVPITHSYVNPKADPADATLIRPSNWNDDHNYPAFTLFGAQFGDDPYVTRVVIAALDDPYGANWYTKVDLTNCLQARVAVYVTQNTRALNSRIVCQYSADGSTWGYLDGVDGPYAVMTPVLTNIIGNWVTITPAARADVWLRWMTFGGDGLSPGLQWHHHYLEVK
jgi:hypothetical protein